MKKVFEPAPQPSVWGRAMSSVKGMFHDDRSPKPLATALQATPLAQATTTVLGLTKGRLLTVALIVLLGGFAFMKLRPYLSYIGMLIDLLRTLLDTSINTVADTSSKIVDNTVDGTDVIIDKLSGSTKKQVGIVPRKSNKEKKAPQPDDSSSSVQSKSGYCYVGDWKGVRSCVRVNGDCPSGKVFESEEACVAK